MLEKQSTLVRKVNVQRMMAHTSGATLWQIAAGFVVVILVSFAFTSGKGSGGRRGWDNAASLPYNQLDDGEIGAAWTTQRLCRHFRAPTPSRVRFMFGVDSPKTLTKTTHAWRRVDIIQVNVGFRLHKDAPPAEARGWRARAKGEVRRGHRPIHRRVSRDCARRVTVHGANQRFHAVRLFATVLRGATCEPPAGRARTRSDGDLRGPARRGAGPALDSVATRLGRLPGPLIVDGEILPGPGGFLPQLGSVFAQPPAHDDTREKHTHAEDDHHLYVPPVPGDLDADALATRRSKTFDFDPRFDFVEKVKKFAPGCVLSVRWSAHGGCVDGAVASRAREAYAKWYRGEPFDWDWAEAEQAPAARSESAAAAAHMFDFAGASPGRSRARSLTRAGAWCSSKPAETRTTRRRRRRGRRGNG